MNMKKPIFSNFPLGKKRKKEHIGTKLLRHETKRRIKRGEKNEIE